MDNYEKLNELHEAMISLDNLYCLWSKKYGITKNELCILSILLSKEGLTQKQIYSKTGITFSTLNSAIKNLASQNYLVFKIDSSNKKEKPLFLIEEGRSYAPFYLTKTMSLAYAPIINVNCICPGWMHTDMTDSNPEGLNDYILSRISKGRFGLPEEVAKVTLFLASEDAEYINGAVIDVDGGYKLV